MIQPPPLISLVPVARAIGPPAEQRAIGNILPRYIHPPARILRFAQCFNFNRSVADNLQQFLVIPDVILARGDVDSLLGADAGTVSMARGRTRANGAFDAREGDCRSG